MSLEPFHRLVPTMRRSSVARIAAAGLHAFVVVGCLTQAVARADLTYFVSKTTGGLYSFETSNAGAGISTLAAAGTFTITDTARQLRIRGDAMQKAVPVGEGAMAALLGADIALGREIAAEAAQGQVCQVANDNGGGVHAYIATLYFANEAT